MNKKFDLELNKMELINLIKNLISINSENPPGDMKDISIYIKSYLEENGASVEKIEPEKGKISLISSIGDPPYLVLNGHMDT
ncbi:MAG: M20 family peptidase, partial [Thermoplasmata archaeon]